MLNLLEWFVKNTKQENRFHVILGTSDSFFHLWIEKFIGASRFKSYVVGNLDRQEAERYWNEVLLKIPNQNPKFKPLEFGDASPKSDDAYRVCGGNLFLLKQYFCEYFQSEGDLTPSTFSMVQADKAVLFRVLQAAGSNEFPNLRKEEALEILKNLVEAKENVLVYRDLCRKHGEQTINDLIEANILHLRSTARYSYDIPNHFKDPIVTPETPASVLAIQELLDEEGIARLQE